MESRELGKIDSINFGFDDRGFLGLNITFKMSGSGVGTSYNVNMSKINEYTKWTEEDRQKSMVELMWRINDLLKNAKVDSVDKLKNTPVEVVLKNHYFQDFRILTEVI